MTHSDISKVKDVQFHEVYLNDVHIVRLLGIQRDLQCKPQAIFCITGPIKALVEEEIATM